MDWDGFAEGHLDAAHEVLTRLRPSIEAVAAGMAERLRQGGKVLVCGNGGSAADAEHITGELLKGFLSKRPLGGALRQAGRPAGRARSGKKSGASFPLA